MTYPSIRDETAHADIVRRLGHLGPDSVRLWGVMDPGQLLPHLVDGVRLALRDEGPAGRGLLATSVMRRLMIHRAAWPPGKAKAPPGAFQRTMRSWDGDRQELFELLDRYRATPPERIRAGHPVFGRMKPGDWDVLVWRHLDHHLRQFGA